ncbi:hypothetical protein H5410_043052 [Solanum commersonii]|uniref:Uncharacterized protein n=1 Tax=Solanum commersonii TaxID=4109 RepID=A0A9J5XXS8_SOLCO|nr:hypothetical protein H5410_043052 [Solanum commersonii]
MVLWEITLGTAYFLGLKRTYKLFLRIQRKLISPKYPRLRDFAQRRTRAAFDMALTVHRKVQERDIEAGRNLGNWILRWLDKMKPSANIRGSDNNAITSATKQLRNSSHSPSPKLSRIMVLARTRNPAAGIYLPQLETHGRKRTQPFP